MRAGKGLVRAGRQEHAAHELLISSVIVADVPLAGLTFGSERTVHAFRLEVSETRNSRCASLVPPEQVVGDGEDVVRFVVWEVHFEQTEPIVDLLIKPQSLHQHVDRADPAESQGHGESAAGVPGRLAGSVVLRPGASNG